MTASLSASYQTTSAGASGVAPKRSSQALAWMERRWTKAEQQVGRLTRHGSLDQSRYDFVHDIGPYRGKSLSLQFSNFCCHLSLSLALDLHPWNCWTRHIERLLVSGLSRSNTITRHHHHRLWPHSQWRIAACKSQSVAN